MTPRERRSARLGCGAMLLLTLGLGSVVLLADERLRAAVAAAVAAGGWWLYAAAARSRSRLARLTLRDPLTGLYNRRYLAQRLAEEASRADRRGGTLVLALVDLDDFKRVNDTRGHLYGDRVLRAFAQAARAALRRSDVAFRYGGEEFVFLFPDTRAGEAVRVLERLMESVVPTRFSAGVAEYPTEERALAALLHLADMRLANAKRAGKGRIQA
jgi:diguanylate cyclase (GGDEF)-like protein